MPDQDRGIRQEQHQPRRRDRHRHRPSPDPRCHRRLESLKGVELCLTTKLILIHLSSENRFRENYS